MTTEETNQKMTELQKALDTVKNALAKMAQQNKEAWDRWSEAEEEARKRADPHHGFTQEDRETCDLRRREYLDTRTAVNTFLNNIQVPGIYITWVTKE